MKFTAWSILSSLALCVVAAPAQRSHVVHERRLVGHDTWIRSDAKLNRDAVVPVSIGLKQRNLEKGYDFLMDVSHPSSPNYGKHWSYEKIRDTFKPTEEAITAVKNWLIESGIGAERLRLAPGHNWVKVNVTIAEAEDLLKTKYDIFNHYETGQPHIACDEYSVPAHVQEHIDFITPTVSFDAMIKMSAKKRSVPPMSPDSTMPGLNSAWTPKKGAAAVATSQAFTLDDCDTYITPQCLQSLYNFSNGTLNGSSYGIVEYTPQAYLQTDLDQFYANMSLNIEEGYGPVVDLIDGAIVQTEDQSFSYNGESDLDLEYAIALVYPQQVTLYQTGDDVEGASFNNFLDAIDASYCTYDGGDSARYDGTYPDTATGGYDGDEDCGTFAPASVISTSYGSNEADYPASYEERQCYEYMKLGLAGVTILYSSGDYGVAGNGGRCCTEAACANGNYNLLGRTGTFNPSFPGTCPYVTSVGATQIKTGSSVTDAEEACETVIYSGGGFSNVFAMPDYQADAVAEYFANYEPSYNSTQYNNSQTVRGYPDVAANGANYVVVVDGDLSLVYGTSASSPVFGSIITLINNERVAAGKSAVGFLNPTLYENSDAFNDITSGGNEGCGTDGFTAVEGWDPVTGLGTPDYEKLLEVFMALD